jgi:hypothetical protein
VIARGRAASKALKAEFWVVVELEDFRGNATPELRERNERLRAAR